MKQQQSSMKTKFAISIVVIFFLLGLPVLSLSQNYDSLNYNKCDLKEYKIIKINKSKKKINGTNKAYIILVQDSEDKQFFTIVSLKAKCKTCLRLKRGRTYNLLLEKYYKYDSFIKIGLKSSVFIDNVWIHIPMNNYTGNIYISSSIKGPYLID